MQQARLVARIDGGGDLAVACGQLHADDPGRCAVGRQYRARRCRARGPNEAARGETLDTLRERANNLLAHEAAGLPPLIHFEYETILDARRFERPASYGLLRITACGEAHLERHHASTAALIVEPLVQGATGMAMHDPLYLARVREITARHDVLLIADEIMTGFGRTGTMFACEQAGIAPDLMLLSKGITGGFLPLACVLASDAIYDAFYDDDTSRGFLHSHSYTGNPLACSAALAVLDIFRDDDVIATNRARTVRRDAIAAPLAAHPKVRNFRRCGMIVAFEVACGRADFARWCFAEGIARGILLRPIGGTSRPIASTDRRSPPVRPPSRFAPARAHARRPEPGAQILASVARTRRGPVPASHPRDSSL